MTYRIGGIDTETTGLDQAKGHRIIEVGFNLFKTNDGRVFEKIGATLCKRLNPLRPIDEKAYQVHGISLADVKDCETWDTFAPKLARLMRSCNLIVAHNSEFDLPFVGRELIRVGEDPGDPEVFCTLQNGRQATAYGNVPNLGQLCWAFGVDYNEDEAHAADYDIDRTMDCFFIGLERGVFTVESLEKYRLAPRAA